MVRYFLKSEQLQTKQKQFTMSSWENEKKNKIKVKKEKMDVPTGFEPRGFAGKRDTQTISLSWHTLFFFIRTSNFGAEAERSYSFCDLSLKTF